MFYILIFVCLISIVFGATNVDDAQITWNEEVQLKLTDSSFYRNLSPTNQAQVLAIYTNEQMTADEMDEEFDDWVNKQTPQIQAAAKQYVQNINLANKEINDYKQEIMSNLSPEARTYLQQIYKNYNNLTIKEILNFGKQLYQSLPPNVKQQIGRYFSQLLKFTIQKYTLYLSKQPPSSPVRPPPRPTPVRPLPRPTPVRPLPRPTPVRPPPPPIDEPPPTPIDEPPPSPIAEPPPSPIAEPPPA